MKEQDLGHGQKIIGFDSEEELYDYLSSQRRASIDALQHTLPSQNKLTFGSFCFRAAPPDLAIFGRILREDEMEDPEELAMTRDARTRGLIYGQWHSVVVPEGEYGSTHIIGCWPITQIEFRLAEATGWHLWPEFYARIQNEIETERELGERQP